MEELDPEMSIHLDSYLDDDMCARDCSPVAPQRS